MAQGSRFKLCDLKTWTFGSDVRAYVLKFIMHLQIEKILVLKIRLFVVVYPFLVLRQHRIDGQVELRSD
jgi:hypothetical protein